jgi:Uri superfamily endonuclease
MSARRRASPVPGTYALVLQVPRRVRVPIGALGPRTFAAGLHVYVGSALGGLAARVERHVKGGRARRWHIDWLRPHARVVAVQVLVSHERHECRLAQVALRIPGATVPVPRFGASDCRCAAHLVRLPGRSALEALVDAFATARR